jgi:pre-mRNA 3'-end-processing factor FIP1
VKDPPVALGLPQGGETVEIATTTTTTVYPEFKQSDLPIPHAPPTHPPLPDPKTFTLDPPTTRDGKSVYEYDLATLRSTGQPWRRPGSDLSDWFNYGFDEDSWDRYLGWRKGMVVGVQGVKDLPNRSDLPDELADQLGVPRVVPSLRGQGDDQIDPNHPVGGMSHLNNSNGNNNNVTDPTMATMAAMAGMGMPMGMNMPEGMNMNLSGMNMPGMNQDMLNQMNQMRMDPGMMASLPMMQGMMQGMHSGAGMDFNQMAGMMGGMFGQQQGQGQAQGQGGLPTTGQTVQGLNVGGGTPRQAGEQVKQEEGDVKPSTLQTVGEQNVSHVYKERGEAATMC